jgi:hypothetical protein
MSNRVWPWAAALGLVAAGCGGGASDEDQVKAAANHYIHGLEHGDWDEACKSRTEKEQKAFAAVGGSCPKAMAAVFKGKSVGLLKGAKAGDVRIRGNVAGVDIMHPSQKGPASTLAAVKDNGEWRLQDMEESKIP